MKFLKIKNKKESTDLLIAAGYRLCYGSIDKGFEWILINPITKIFSYGETEASYTMIMTKDVVREDYFDANEVNASRFKQNRKKL